ncbi:MAG: efflux RND transporter periplasmic adaptor subunit [Roseateles sp.]|uniref:Cobalt-zinc-cadmium efflux system membrane fusion protein n=1 Tax=Roseateles asaccharophilus TaxID=582607 RepID=A0ABU2AGH8_9BURK|nr:efflux RND transporter periplasmic adaptor subunit [Roseateles asaccharophilus]MDR7336190.1 cobalt-zinc-cadmium efflux system membrane fusion protein [Roseateles asaccharophilus]
MKFNQSTTEGLRASLGKKQLIAIAVVLALGAVGTVSILRMGGSAPAGEEEHGHGHDEAKGHGDDEHHGEAKDAKGHKDADGHGDGEHHEEAKKGSNGGEVLGTQKGLAVEMLLAEEGGTARIKVWVTNAGKPVSVKAEQVSVQLERPGQDPEKVSFAIQAGALVSAQAIEEPHLFKGTVNVQTGDGVLTFPFAKDEGAVTMTADQIKAAGISIDTSAPATIRTALKLPGEIAFNEDKTAHVVPRVGGVVESVAVSLGQQVTKGQVLAVISSSSVSDQRAELQAAQKRLQLARTTYEREKQLFEQRISPQQDVQQAEQAMREAEIAVANARQKLNAIGASPDSSALNRFELRAPFNGVIVEKHIALGEQVREDVNVFTISDLRSVWAQINVPASSLPQVRIGENVTIRSTAFEQTAVGKVAYVGALIGEQTRTAQARVVVDNPKTAWRPGLFVNVEVSAGESSAPVTVTADAVQTMEGKSVVFVRTASGFAPIPVELGRSDGKRTEVTSGLKAGAQYATSGAFVIKSEAGKASASHAH